MSKSKGFLEEKMEEIDMKENIKQLATWYNTWGYDSPFCREAEKRLVNNDKKAIKEARELAAMARQVM